MQARAGLSAKIAVKYMPRCRVGRSLYLWQGEAACRFLGGKFTKVRRHHCGRKHGADKFVKVRRCVYEPKVTGKGLFTGRIRKMKMEGRVRVTSKPGGKKWTAQS
jgi:hypothetical protein